MKLINAVGQAVFSLGYPGSTSYCTRCQSFEFWTANFSIVDNWEELERSRKKCAFCKMRWELCNQLDREKTPLIRFDRDRSMLKLNNGSSPVLSIHRSLGKLTRLQHKLGDTKIDCHVLETQTLKTSHIQIGFPHLTPITSQTYFEILRQWLRDCDAEHTECFPQSVGSLPTRLIHLTGQEPTALCLYETQPSDKLEYTALSHPWGEKPHFCTTLANIKAHQKAIDFENLPATFKDAITVTRELGLEYLWIDSICIIQGEGGDFNHEAKRMEDVFSSAVCVLAASSAHGQQDGFLNPRRQTPQSLSFDYSKGLPTLFLSPFMDKFSDDVLEAPLSKRGWVLQERALARRTIFFTNRQTYWECGEGVRCETMTKMDK